MSPLTSWLSAGLVSDIGWTLIHFLWQGVALAALLYLALPFFRNAVEGDLLFTAVMFATPVALHKLAEAFGQSDHTAAV